MSGQPRCACGETTPHRLHRMTKWERWACVNCLERAIDGLEDQIDHLDRQLDRALPSVPGRGVEHSMVQRAEAKSVTTPSCGDREQEQSDG